MVSTLTEPSEQFRKSRNKHLQFVMDFVRKEIRGENDIVNQMLMDEERYENEKVCVDCGC